MTLVEKRKVGAYATLVMANRMTLEDVPDTPVTLDDGTESTLRLEVEVEIATRTINILS